MKRKANANSNLVMARLRAQWHAVYQSLMRARTPERQLELYRQLKAIEGQMRGGNRR